jgi:hypothetical protein
MWACTAGALVTGLAWAYSAAMADEGPSPAVTRVAKTALAAQAGESGARHLGVDSTLGELLRHPAFAGYARRLLPRDDGAIDETLRIERIGSLLPYHSHVVPDVVHGALNHLIDEVGRGRPVFYELYTPAEQQDDPTKASTGLFFFRGRPGAPFALIAPGGGCTSARFTRASRTRSRSAARATMPSCCVTELARVSGRRPRTWPRR